MISALVTIMVLNALCAVPMALCVRRDFARLGRVSLPIAIWSVRMWGVPFEALRYGCWWWCRDPRFD